MCDQTLKRFQPVATSRRLKLWEIKPRFHYAILGTCLTMAELRKVVRQSGVIPEERPSDYDLHAVIVAQAEQSGRAARNVPEMLDTKCRRWVRASSKCRDSQGLARHWQGALASGDIAGTSWALMTHPYVDSKLVRRAYEDVHMLSHLQGASNRADRKRLRSLKRELAELQEALHKTRRYQQQQIRKRDDLIRRQARELEVAGISQSPRPGASDAESIAGLPRSRVFYLPIARNRGLQVNHKGPRTSPAAPPRAKLLQERRE